jgi:TonB-like protein
MSKELKIAGLLVLALGLILRTTPDAIAQTSSPPGAKPRVVSVNSLVVDSFDSVSRWSTNWAQGVEITVHPDSGRHGAGLRLDFDFHGHPGYGIIHRELDLDLPANYEFTFAVRGDAPTNTLEFKLVDASGANVWWSNNPYFVFPREWRTIARHKGQICFAWGPRGDSAPLRYDPGSPGCRSGIDIHRVAAIEFAITAGSGGKGSVWIDDLLLTALDPDSPDREGSRTGDDGSTQTYFEFQVERPAAMFASTPTPKYPRGLERSGRGGEVQAQFVVRKSGKVDMDSFKVLKSPDERLSQAVRDWIVGITFSPAMIGGVAVNQLVQQSFTFAVPR